MRTRQGALSLRGQSLTECAVLLGVILVAVTGTATLIKRSAQGVMKGATDDLLRIDAEDASGELTQTRGVESLRPVGMEEDAVLSTYSVTSTGQTGQSYSGGALNLDNDVTTTRTGTETSREFTGPAQPGPPAGGPDGEPTAGGDEPAESWEHPRYR